MNRHTRDLIAIYQDMARVQAEQARSYRLRDMGQNATVYAEHAAIYAAIARALLFAVIEGNIK